MTSRKVAYSLASLPSALLYGAFFTFVMFFYVDQLKMPLAQYSLAMVIFSIWNAINDPLAGQLSDRTRTKWGRRTPYIALGSLPLALSFILLWTPPSAVTAMGGMTFFVYFLLVICLFDTLYTVVILNWTALFPEMYPSLDERAQVSAFRQVFGIIGQILAVTLLPVLSEALGYGQMGLIFATVAFVFLMVSLWGSQERREFQHDEAISIVDSLKYTFNNWSFVTFVAVSLFIQLSFVLLQAAIPFYAKYALGLGGSGVSLLLGVIFVTAIPMVYLWQRVTIRLGARKAMLWALLGFGLALQPFFLANSLAAAAITGVAIGSTLAGVLILIDILLADVVDEDELRTGARREGIYFGMNALMIRLGVALQAVITAAVLQATGYNADLALQPASAILGIRLLVTVIPLASIAIALIALHYYPLHGGRLEEVKGRVAELHARKAARGTEVL